MKSANSTTASSPKRGNLDSFSNKTTESSFILLPPDRNKSQRLSRRQFLSHNESLVIKTPKLAGRSSNNESKKIKIRLGLIYRPFPFKKSSKKSLESEKTPIKKRNKSEKIKIKREVCMPRSSLRKLSKGSSQNLKNENRIFITKKSPTI